VYSRTKPKLPCRRYTDNHERTRAEKTFKKGKEGTSGPQRSSSPSRKIDKRGGGISASGRRIKKIKDELTGERQMKSVLRGSEENKKKR